MMKDLLEKTRALQDSARTIFADDEIECAGGLAGCGIGWLFDLGVPEAKIRKHIDFLIDALAAQDKVNRKHEAPPNGNQGRPS